MLVGSPSLQNGVAFVQVDFHPTASDKDFAIQPGASITFTRIDPYKSGVWHGRLTVKRQTFEATCSRPTEPSRRTGARGTERTNRSAGGRYQNPDCSTTRLPRVGRLSKSPLPAQT
jgi:hypothetical protein